MSTEPIVSISIKGNRNDIPLNFDRKFRDLLKRQERMLSSINGKIKRLDEKVRVNMVGKHGPSGRKKQDGKKKKKKKFYLEESRLIHEQRKKEEEEEEQQQQQQRKRKGKKGKKKKMKKINRKTEEKRRRRKKEGKTQKDSHTWEAEEEGEEDNYENNNIEDESLPQSNAPVPTPMEHVHSMEEDMIVHEEPMLVGGDSFDDERRAFLDMDTSDDEDSGEELVLEREEEENGNGKYEIDDRKDEVDRMIKENFELINQMKNEKEDDDNGKLLSFEYKSGEDIDQGNVLNQSDEYNIRNKKKLSKKGEFPLDLEETRKEKKKLEKKLEEKKMYLKSIEKEKKYINKKKKKKNEIEDIFQKEKEQHDSFLIEETKKERERKFLDALEKRKQLISLQISLLDSKIQELEQEHDIILAEMKNPKTFLTGHQMKEIKLNLNDIMSVIQTIEEKKNEFHRIEGEDKVFTDNIIQCILDGSLDEKEDEKKLKDLSRMFLLNTKKINNTYKV